ncbi:PIG-L deacetylase family protein [Acinetobacter radioresistens]|uniref:PIG-L deacetylase family protein n=1 Tax=Acinetobacter radioresistens TaxID=40216 RepID=UPI003215B226
MDVINSPVGDRLIYGNGTTKRAWQQWSGLQSLQTLVPEQAFPAGQRILIIAPHPDDEILGCAGLIQQLSTLEREILLVAVTNGTQSHPDSQLYTPQQLDQLRPQESLNALKVLGVQNRVNRIALQLTDGEVTAEQQKLYAALKELVRPDDILVCTFAKDGHPDHEATGQTVQRLADQQQLSCYQVLIWSWHWSRPQDNRIPWKSACKLELTAAQLRLKKQAIQCFKSQLETDPSTGQAPILSSHTVERILMPCEVYIHA